MGGFTACQLGGYPFGRSASFELPMCGCEPVCWAPPLLACLPSFVWFPSCLLSCFCSFACFVFASCCVALLPSFPALFLLVFLAVSSFLFPRSSLSLLPLPLWCLGWFGLTRICLGTCVFTRLRCLRYLTRFASSRVFFFRRLFSFLSFFCSSFLLFLFFFASVFVCPSPRLVFFRFCSCGSELFASPQL